ncbi:uncharacterized protein TM35_000081160 [Trypanosoma theileri]|uniref:NERD domain-containing protein n=1 Tax=Trypanosoma theileri TaxID=67003 RepID=A0A1X0P0I4_9TRYP|nr:uncharacterized protein TM35_000081160 [Trypanosoma theileri]ORC90318.1 hypothetical protein TM35_000081160 [Trypanosoma theileri]
MLDYVDDVLYWLPYALLAIPTLLLLVVAAGLRRGIFRDSLSSWSWRHILSFARMSVRDSQFLASMEAEELVEAALRAAGWKHVFLRRRVHVQRLGHNREIDVVAVGPVVLVVEVKHWRGQVWCNGPRWFHRSHDSKRALEFEDIQEDNLVKAAALRRFIENSRRIALPDHHSVTSGISSTGDAGSNASREHGTWYTDRQVHKQCGTLVVPVVVFTNSAVVLDPSTVKQKDCVFDLLGFQAYAEQLMHEARGPSVFRGFWGDGVVRSLCHTLFHPTKVPLSLSLSEESRVASAIRTMRTWDMVYLHNGSLLHGDVTEICLPTIRRQFERKHVIDVQINWFEGIGGFLRSLWEGGGGVVRVRLGPAQRLAIGRSEVVFPLTRRNIRRMGSNDRLEMVLAGTKVTKTVALADIRTLHFSSHMEDSHS